MNSAPSGRPSLSSYILAFAGIYLIWGSTYLGIRVAIESMPPFAMAAMRFLLAGSLLWIFVACQGPARPNLRQVRDNAVVGVFLLVGGNGLVAWAEQYIHSGVTALIIAVGPLFMVLTEWAWPGGQKPTRATVAGLALGFAGVSWLAAPWEAPAEGGLHVGGVIAILSACVFWSLGSIYGRRVRQPATPLLASSIQMVAGGAVLSLLATLQGEWGRLDLSAVSARSWIAFAYLTVIGSLVGFSTYVWLMKHSTPARVSTYAYVNPVVAVILGALILDEPVSSRTAVAAALIVIAVVIITTQKRTPAPVPAPVTTAPAGRPA